MGHEKFILKNLMEGNTLIFNGDAELPCHDEKVWDEIT